MRIAPATTPRQFAAFTMVEIAICLAIIGIALVGIIGVLPIGMNTQRDTREETILNQDVSVLIPIISQGLRGDDDLTNYVYAITNYWGYYQKGRPPISGSVGYTFSGTSATPANPPYAAQFFSPVLLTNGANIVALLSTPEYVNQSTFQPLPNISNGGISNHIVAYVHSMSGLASEKPPQDNQLMVNDAFSYRMVVVNPPVALDTNLQSQAYFTPYDYQLWNNQHELRLSFYYPLQPNGSVGPNQLTFRTTIAGQLLPTFTNGLSLYFYRPQSFGMNTN
jgi:type II secretory pathway pseudopilin PulG